MTDVSMIEVNRHSEIIAARGFCRKNLTAHSTFKFFQIMPVFLLGLDHKYGLTEQELTVMMSSHLAQTEHIAVLDALLEKTGIKERDLVLPPSAPAGRISYCNWKKAKLPARKLYHPCSGKHIGMILGHRELTGKTEGYEEQNCKLQKMIYDIVLSFTECHPQMVRIAIDNCRVPTYNLPMKSIAVAFKNLVFPSQKINTELRDIAHKIRRYCSRFPILLEGDGCLSSILTAKEGLLAKTGTGGILAVGIENKGCGVVIKSEQGNWEAIINHINMSW